MTMAAGGSQSALRAGNLARVVDALTRSGVLSQAELVAVTSLSHATISNLVGLLEADGRIEVTEGRRNGRRAKLVRLTSAFEGVFLAAYVERDQITAALGGAAPSAPYGAPSGATSSAAAGPATDAGQRTLPARTVTGVHGIGYQEGLGLIKSLADDLVEQAGLAPGALLGAGVGLAMAFDAEAGRVPSALRGRPQLERSWLDAPVTADLAKLLGVPAMVENDANLAAFAEARIGSAKGARDMVYLHLSEGIGGGLVLGGRLHRGTSGMAGELGHTTIDPYGDICYCGNRGCLETRVGSAALLKPLRQVHGDGLSPAEFVRLVQSGDRGCRRVAEDAGTHIGAALAGLVNALAPSHIVLGGELSGAGDVLVGSVRRTLARLAGPALGVPAITTSALGRRAVLAGALLFAAETAGFDYDFKKFSLIGLNVSP